MINSNLDVTKQLLNEIDLLNYVDYDNALAIHHQLVILKSNIENLIKSEEHIELRDRFQKELVFVKGNIKVLDNFIENIYNVPEFQYNNFKFLLN